MTVATDRFSGLVGSVGIKRPVRVASTANITLDGLQTIDGISIVEGDRVLLKDQTNAVENGIWIANGGAWNRATDFNGVYDAELGTQIYIQEGAVNQGEIFVLRTSNPVIGVSPLVFREVFFETEVQSLPFNNVKDFGAVGDGVTDDTAAIQAAMDLGGNIKLPRGRFKITDTLLFKVSNTTLEGANWGTVICMDTQSINKPVIGVDPTTPSQVRAPIVTNLAIDGQWAFVRTPTSEFSPALYTTPEGYTLVDRRIAPTAGDGHGVEFRGTWGAKLYNCHVYNCYGCGVLMIGNSSRQNVDNYIYTNKIEFNKLDGVSLSDNAATLDCSSNIIGFHDRFGIRLNNVDTRVNSNHVFGCRDNIRAESMNGQICDNHVESARRDGIVFSGTKQNMCIGNTSVKNGRTSAADLQGGQASNAGLYSGILVTKNDVGLPNESLIITGNVSHSEETSEKNADGNEILLQKYGLEVLDTLSYDYIIVENNNFKGNQKGGFNLKAKTGLISNNNHPLNEHYALDINYIDAFQNKDISVTLSIGAFAAGAYLQGPVAIFDITMGHNYNDLILEGEPEWQEARFGRMIDYRLYIGKRGLNAYNYRLQRLGGFDDAYDPVVTQTVVTNTNQEFMLQLSIENQRGIFIRSVQQRNAISSSFYTIEQTTDPIKRRVLLGGQSNASYRNFFARNEFKTLSGDMEYILGSSIGTPLVFANGGRWYNSNAQVQQVTGAGWNFFRSALVENNSKSLSKITHVLWDHGEADFVLNFADDYREAVLAIFAQTRVLLPGIEFYITIPQATSNQTTVDGVTTPIAQDGSGINESAQNIRDTYYDLIQNYSYIKKGAERFDLIMADPFHLRDDQYAILAARDNQILNGGAIGPEVTNVILSGTTLTITITHDGGTDFTPTTDIQGFYFDDGGAEIILSNVSRVNATTITATLASIPVSSNKKLYYIYGDINHSNVTDLTKLVKDNASLSMPLRSMTWNIA